MGRSPLQFGQSLTCATSSSDILLPFVFCRRDFVALLRKDGCQALEIIVAGYACEPDLARGIIKHDVEVSIGGTNRTLIRRETRFSERRQPDEPLVVAAA
jgi:hypothetical protein